MTGGADDDVSRGGERSIAWILGMLLLMEGLFLLGGLMWL